MSEDENRPSPEAAILLAELEADPLPDDVALRHRQDSLRRIIANGGDPAVAAMALGLPAPPPASDPLAAGGAPSLGPQVAIDLEAPAAD